MRKHMKEITAKYYERWQLLLRRRDRLLLVRELSWLHRTRPGKRCQPITGV